MRISELVDRTGVPLATVKYYLREGLLMPGQATGATQADYDDAHVERLGLIRALIDVAGLSVKRAKAVIDVIEHPESDLVRTIGRALEELPPYGGSDAAEYPRAKRAIEALGQVYDPDYAAVAQLERALAAAEAAGVPMTDDRLRAYGGAIMELAEFDIGNMSTTDPADAVKYAVLGTALYEPVIAAMRRLAHQDAVYRALGGSS
ncbi:MULTISPECIES: MerR family transcriptional regulator [unclassified Cryobacterium]|uniref:MerR family transcriptional regulator n=1 Tax=unclassified Cryobacterium TaxID=2649013 RepID=UPI001446E85F